MDTSHVFPQSVMAVIPLIGGVIGVVVSGDCTGCGSGPTLCPLAVTALSGGRVCSTVLRVETLRVGFDQAPLPLKACPALKEVTTE